ncbi:MAG: hypothetical protein HC806_04375 [Anaerolineae bacterium]|nr:hypothetical protein [Anaerolineae bacterium]
MQNPLARLLLLEVSKPSLPNPIIITKIRMTSLQINNQTHPLRSPLQVDYCTSFLCQLRGLTFRRSLPPNWGLLLVQQKESRLDAAIHMFMMWMDLAVVWINSAHQVVDVRKAFRWKSVIIPKAPAKYVLELPIDRLNDFQIGDQIEMVP